MEEFTAVSEATKASLLVVFTNVGLVIPAHGGTQMLGSSDGALPHHSGGSIAHRCILGFHVFLIIVDSPIDLVIFLAPQLLLDLFGEASLISWQSYIGIPINFHEEPGIVTF